MTKLSFGVSLQALAATLLLHEYASAIVKRSSSYYVYTPPGFDSASKKKYPVLYGLLDPNRKLIAWLREQGLTPMAIETPGMHVWMVWRDNLANFVPLLFQPKK